MKSDKFLSSRRCEECLYNNICNYHGAYLKFVTRLRRCLLFNVMSQGVLQKHKASRTGSEKIIKSLA